LKGSYNFNKTDWNNGKRAKTNCRSWADILIARLREL
jgi:hypothetical protein